MSTVTLYSSGPPTGLDLGVEGAVVTNYGPGTVSYSDAAEPFVAEGTIAATASATLTGTQFFRTTTGAVLGLDAVREGSTEAQIAALEARTPAVDTTDATMDDAVAITVPSRKPRRIPIADKLVFDLREFYSGTSQPADVLGHIHDGLAKTVVAGGWLQIPDSEEPWDVGSTIVPPPNSRMMAAGGMSRYTERSGGAHGAAAANWPVLPNSLGQSVIRLANGVNAPILANDHANAVGKRGPIRSAAPVGGTGKYWQWFTALGIVFDANGHNQTAGRAIDIRDAFGMNFPYCGLMRPRGVGWAIAHCSDCNGEKTWATGGSESVANGVGDLASSVTVLNASGSWAKGDQLSGAGIPAGAYLTNVVGSTLTLSAAATTTSAAVALTKLVYIATDLLLLEESTTDSEWLGISMHAAQNIVTLDSCHGNRVSGLAGYAIGGHNLRLQNTQTAHPNYNGVMSGNYVDLRTDQATKHNVRIDATCNDNDIHVDAFAPGLFGTANDADAGWASIFCDGKGNRLTGVGYKGAAIAVNMSAVVAYGPNAERNNGLGMAGGSDLAAGTRLFSYRPTSPAVPGKIYTNSNPAQPPFFVGAPQFEPTDGTSPVDGTFNGTYPVLVFADAVTQSAVAYFTVPHGCNGVSFYVLLGNLDPAQSGNAMIQLGYSDSALGGGNTISGDEASTGFVALSFSANQQTRAAAIGPGLTFALAPNVSPGDYVALRFKRSGGHASDTLAAAIGLLGVRVEPLLVA